MNMVNLYIHDVLLIINHYLLNFLPKIACRVKKLELMNPGMLVRWTDSDVTFRVENNLQPNQQTKCLPQIMQTMFKEILPPKEALFGRTAERFENCADVTSLQPCCFHNSKIFQRSFPRNCFPKHKPKFENIKKSVPKIRKTRLVLNIYPDLILKESRPRLKQLSFRA